LGVEPAHNIAQVATAAGIPTMVKFLSAISSGERMLFLSLTPLMQNF